MRDIIAHLREAKRMATERQDAFLVYLIDMAIEAAVQQELAEGERPAKTA